MKTEAASTVAFSVPLLLYIPLNAEYSIVSQPGHRKTLFRAIRATGGTHGSELKLNLKPDTRRPLSTMPRIPEIFSTLRMPSPTSWIKCCATASTPKSGMARSETQRVFSGAHFISLLVSPRDWGLPTCEEEGGEAYSDGLRDAS